MENDQDPPPPLLLPYFTSFLNLIGLFLLFILLFCQFLTICEPRTGEIILAKLSTLIDITCLFLFQEMSFVRLKGNVPSYLVLWNGPNLVWDKLLLLCSLIMHYYIASLNASKFLFFFLASRGTSVMLDSHSIPRYRFPFFLLSLAIINMTNRLLNPITEFERLPICLWTVWMSIYCDCSNVFCSLIIYIICTCVFISVPFRSKVNNSSSLPSLSYRHCLKLGTLSYKLVNEKAITSTQRRKDKNTVVFTNTPKLC